MKSFRKTLSMLIIFTAFCWQGVTAQQASLSVGILPFNEKGKKAKESDEIVSELTGILYNYKFIKLVDRSEMDSYFNEVKLGQTGIIDQDTVVEVGKVHGLQVMITGTISNGKISAQVVHTESRRVLAAVSGKTAADIQEFGLMFARSIEIFLNQENIRKLENENSGIPFLFWAEKSSGGKTEKLDKSGSVAVGDTIVFHFKSDVDGYLTIVDIQPGGDITVLYPNDFSGDGKIKAGTEYTVPSADDGFEITIGEPYGRDIVKAFFTTKKVDWLDRKNLQGEGFLTVKEKEKGSSTRGIYVTATKLKKNEWATKFIELEVVKGK